MFGPVLVPIAITVVCVLWTLGRIPVEDQLGTSADNKAKLREFLVHDIRAISQYCAGYLAVIGVVATVVASNVASFKPILNAAHLWPFGIAFFAAAFSSLFIPAGFGERYFTSLRCVWVRSVACEQLTVIYTCYGIWDAFVTLT